MELEGKNALVTAGSRGIGRAIALALGERGANVVVNYRTSADAADQIVETISAGGGKAVAVQADLGVPEDVARLFEEAERAFGRLDIVVNNVGVNLVAPLAETTEDDFDRTVAVNFKGSFLVLRNAARIVSDDGRIISISTGNTRVTMPMIGVYAATKAAVEQMTYSLAKEVGSRGITVNVVLPGLTDTDGLRPEIRENAAGIIGMTPLGRMGRPEDVADVVAFLASEKARWVTGQAIGASGGLS
ncbi:SDR family oxidoreductase [Promicromonospora sp. NPDC057488]|uniref:SDR family oxidoreductase n=1 Tax=Promicromonospora sp. NPDC057488 TaxID=3346147 RepID=UPI0036724838